MLELFQPDWREVWKGALAGQAVGAVYTKPEIVDLILDLAGYRPDERRLANLRVLEPSCGDGAFLVSIVSRLIESERRHTKRIRWSDARLDAAVCAVDLNLAAVEAARASANTLLVAAGCPIPRAAELSAHWTRHGDFLLTRWDEPFDFVVGNPPYVRLEDLPRNVLVEYRRQFSTLTDRADLYIAFFQQGLRLLSEDGVLAFICANRFAKNQYGAELRRLIASRYHVRHYVNLEHTQPFLSDVSAYPAIVTLDRKHGLQTLAGTLAELSPRTIEQVRKQGTRASKRGPLSAFATWYGDGGPWSTTSAVEAARLVRLRTQFAVLEESAVGTRVGIGVATGADNVFVLQSRDESIEADRQVALAVSSDVSPQSIAWSGHVLVNPFAPVDDGQLVSLEQYPGLRAHFFRHELLLRRRHVAKSRPESWYRTIDRVWPSLTFTPKLLIPDIQLGGIVGYDDGSFYPHHNLYWITSETWDLRALQALLRSSHVLMQVRAFSVQMRGGSVRYQAQTLRRVRIPSATSLSSSVVEQLRSVAASPSQAEVDEAASLAFGFVATDTAAA